MNDPDVNTPMFDKWTLVHMLNGLGVGLLGVRPAVAAAGAVAYEIAEYAHEWPRGSKLFGSKGPESPQNIAADLALFGVLYMWGKKLRRATPDTVALTWATFGAAALMAYTFTPSSRPAPEKVLF